MRIRTALGMAAMITSLGLVGCGDEVAMVPVTGTVKVDGKAVSKEGYSVTITVGSKQSGVEVNADGTFSGNAIEGKGKATLNEPSGADSHGGGDGDDAGGADAPPPPASAIYSVQDVEIKSGATLDLSFTKQ